MELNEINFTFAGSHCYRDYGCWAIWSKKPMAPKAKRDSYAIGGRSGTVLLTGTPVYDEMQWQCQLAFRKPPRSEQQAQRQWRAVCAWLRAGRAELTLDSEPGRYWLAQVDAPIDWGNDAWDEGQLTVTFTVQPYSFARDESSSSAVFAAAGSLPLLIPSVERVPVQVLLRNLGTALLTDITIALGDAAVALEGIDLAQGDTAEIRMDTPIGAKKYRTADGVTTVTDLLPYAVRFDPLEGMGAMVLTVTPVFVGLDASVSVLASGRGVSV
ncbi:MAG: hypothetical protein VB104_07980 [Candidatus Limiplasma sp.]|nr:hypothetical protein [Candidatus Limiplasma sp.]